MLFVSKKLVPFFYVHYQQEKRIFTVRARIVVPPWALKGGKGAWDFLFMVFSPPKMVKRLGPGLPPQEVERPPARDYFLS